MGRPGSRGGRRDRRGSILPLLRSAPWGGAQGPGDTSASGDGGAETPSGSAGPTDRRLLVSSGNQARKMSYAPKQMKKTTQNIFKRIVSHGQGVTAARTSAVWTLSWGGGGSRPFPTEAGVVHSSRGARRSHRPQSPLPGDLLCPHSPDAHPRPLAPSVSPSCVTLPARLRGGLSSFALLSY